MRRHQRTLPCIFALLLCGSAFQTTAAAVQGKLTFTTKSEKARALFVQGLAKYDRARLREAAPLFRQAVEADPKFALGYLFVGLAGDSVPDMRKAAELVDSRRSR